MKKLLTINEEGFSLLEVSLAVGIMALLTAMAVPTFTGMIPSVKAKVNSANCKYTAVDNKIEELAAASNGTTYNAPAPAQTCSPQ